MDINEIAKEWGNPIKVRIRKPSIEEACDVVMSLILEVSKARKEAAEEKKRQDIKAQQLKIMMIELQNTINKYT